MKRVEISQEIKPRQQCDQSYALLSTPRNEQLSTHGKKKKTTVGRGDVEMHGKEINSGKKNREENVKTKKGTVEASVQLLNTSSMPDCVD